MGLSIRRDIIVIGGSAGGVEALKKLLRDFPRDFPGSIFVVLHLWPEGKSILPNILSSVGNLPAEHPADGDPIKPGRIYVAQNDCHLMVKDSAIRMVRGPRENRHRPAVDPLFRSAAVEFGNRVAGVILTGNMDDGTAGLIAVKRRDGLAIVQDPSEAMYRGMPESAIRNVEVDHVLPIEGIRELLLKVAANGSARNPTPEPSAAVRKEVDSAMGNDKGPGEYAGDLTVYTCPECQGPLWEIEEAKFVRYRCRVGHSFSADLLVAEMDEKLERALWMAARTLEDGASLHHRIAERARESNLPNADVHEDSAVAHANSAETIRALLKKNK